MEDRRRKSISGEKFSFPNIPTHDQDPEFEFGCVTPGPPNSPADHLFFNGRLLPHSFPAQPTNTAGNYTRSASRTSSVSSKDSLMSSRSNSTNSRSSSCCTSARTSTSEASSERRSLSLNQPSKSANHNRITKEKYQAVLLQQYGSSRRWQFIAPAPALSRQTSRRKKAEILVRGERKGEEDRGGARMGFCRRFLRSFVSACKECHAIN